MMMDEFNYDYGDDDLTGLLTDTDSTIEIDDLDDVQPVRCKFLTGAVKFLPVIRRTVINF